MHVMSALGFVQAFMYLRRFPLVPPQHIGGINYIRPRQLEMRDKASLVFSASFYLFLAFRPGHTTLIAALHRNPGRPAQESFSEFCFTSQPRQDFSLVRSLSHRWK